MPRYLEIAGNCLEIESFWPKSVVIIKTCDEGKVPTYRHAPKCWLIAMINPMLSSQLKGHGRVHKVAPEGRKT